MQPPDQGEDIDNALHSISIQDDSPPSRSVSPLTQSTSTSSPRSDPTIQAEPHEHSTARQEEETIREGVANERDPDLRTANSTPPTQWTEPEAGFTAINLNDDEPVLSPMRRSSTPPPHPQNTASSTSVASLSPTRTPPRSESASTAPTTVAATSSPSSPSASTNDVEQSAKDDSTNSGMSKPPDASKVEQPSPVKKGQSTKAPSMMQRVVSMTRQRDLPPKSKEEEEKHLKQLADMFAASKESEKRRRSELEAKSAARATALASALPTWESSILPNWRSVLHPTSEGRHLRKLWWSGTMPVRFRGRLWSLCIGNGLAVSKNAYSSALAKAKKGLEEGREDMTRVKREAEMEMEETLPTLKLFQKGGVMHEDLLDLLLAWSVHDPLTPPRYPQGLAYPASLLLVNMPPSEAFISLVNLISKSFLRSFYSTSPLSLNSYERVFDTLLADFMPKVYANFSSSMVRPSTYLKPWLTTLFVHFLPLDLSTRLFDVFLLEGDSFCFRVSLVLLQILEPRLFNPNLEELRDVFKGRDSGAVAIVKREKGLLRSTATGEEETQEETVQVEDVYTEMGCTEERVFELLDKLDWKEETWERLIERELPEAD